MTDRKLRLRSSTLQWREVDGEIVALEAASSTYLTANKAGALLWEALSKGVSRDQLVALLVATFAIDADSARADVDRFIDELAAHDLLER